MSSRLFMEVREKRGLAYSVHAWAEKYPDTGYVAVQAGVQHGKLEKTVQVILAEFKKVKRTKVSDVELKKAKAFIKGTSALALETSDALAENASSSLINGGALPTPEKITGEIDTVPAGDMGGAHAA